MIPAFKRYWFLAGLLLLLPLGIILGRSAAVPGLDAVVKSVSTTACTGGILFLMSVTLDSGKLMKAMRRPLPVVTACGINMGLLPLMCLPFLAMNHTPDMKVGLLIVVSVPCTMATASVWTRKAGGNDAVSLLVTLLTNGFCFLITPAWMEIGRRLFETADTSGVTFGDLVERLMFSAMIPAVAGQIARLHPEVRLQVDDSKALISTIAQTIILTLVFVSSFKGGRDFDVEGTGGGLPLEDVLLVWAICIGLHLAAAVAAWWISGLIKIEEIDRRAVVIAGSQKTLPIALLLSDATGMSLSIIPMLLYHASQLFIDTWIADRLNQRPVAKSSYGDSQASGGRQPGDPNDG